MSILLTEHLFVRKFFAPLPMPSLADKLTVREYVRARLGEEVLTPVVWVGDAVSDLKPSPHEGRSPHHGFYCLAPIHASGASSVALLAECFDRQAKAPP
jgi:hypothetical protein